MLKANETDGSGESKEGTIFVLDPNEDDTRVFSLKLEKRGYNLVIFKSSVELIRNLHQQQNNVKIIVTEYNLPDEKRNGLDIIQHITSQIPDPPPIIMFSAEGNEQIAIEAIKLGAMDYIPKSRGWYNHIHLRIIHSIVHKNMLNEVKELRSLTDAVFESSFDSIAVVESTGKILHCNQKLCDLLEFSREELLEKVLMSKIFKDVSLGKKTLSDIGQGHVINDYKTVIINKFGLDIPVSFSATYMYQVNKLMFIFSDLREKEELVNQINELKRVASEKIILSAFKVGEFGPEILCLDSLRLKEYFSDELLMKMAIFFSVSLGQGDNIHKGLYGPLPMPVLEEGPEVKQLEEKYVSILYSINLIDEENKDERARGLSFTLITINMPEVIVDVFNKRKQLEELVESILNSENITNVNQITPELLFKIKTSILSMDLRLE